MSSSATHSSGRRADRALVLVEAVVGLGVVAAIVGKSYGAPSTIMFVLAGLALAFTSAVILRMVSALKDETLDLPGQFKDQAREELEEEKMILLQGIKEFEADAGQGKVDAEDYESLRRTAEARAIEILRTLQSTDAEYMQRAEKLIRQRTGGAKVERKPAPAASPAPTAATATPSASKGVVFVEREGHFVCSSCGAENEADGRFCVGCGKPREGAVA